MTILKRLLILLPNYLDFSLLYGSLGGGWQGGAAGGWREAPLTREVKGCKAYFIA